MSKEETINHRTRVAASRREKTRARLLESALLVFAQKGPHAVIEDVIAHAGMARGSFYNYFRTNEELLAAVASEINDELVRAIDPAVQRCADPAERIACGMRMQLQAVVRFPLVGTFMARLPFPTANSSLLGLQYMGRDLALGIRARRFRNISQPLAADVTIGVVLSAAYAAACGPVERNYVDASARALLRALGMGDAEAARVATLPLPAFELPASSILRRTEVVPELGAVAPASGIILTTPTT
ncbi:TetR/AcrR family transcriptional regulator [Telluria aromaticivorans]|uniref:TetR/AcrR family transcriptional regulator n=1 Tax=Telluria aromaticivorans TaxID=2725995 RepID=A0A7Y2NZB8_9BURK|nr:TetR/AcrR family transcriptional regulator [Telluria aromaticivorans]NNG22978.1 TetR/AcrR family transcriptional regulator [Telluria aromaticivorans]